MRNAGLLRADSKDALIGILPGRLNTGIIQKPITNVSVDSTTRTIAGAGIVPAPLAAPVP